MTAWDRYSAMWKQAAKSGAEPVSWPGQRADLTGVPEKPLRDEQGTGPRREIRIWFLAADLVAPQKGATMTYSGVAYVVIKIWADGCGGIWVNGEC